MRDESGAIGVKGTRIRCAIYTRKSTEEGLDQDFNSLDAQREAAEAYIKSQKHLGWTLVPSRYDDGGFSGSSLERPALQKLLEDVDASRVDCVVVYKVDRLSRSLLDFARLVDRFDQRSISFVSVTQQFNTTTSLGRLTLNILLSFAQFEREIISERTRDKMSAARRKGKWIGGTPVLGYDVDPAGGRLDVNEKEAVKVRQIFELFRTKRSLTATVNELTRRRWTTKVWCSKRGKEHPGNPFKKASLRRLLTNAIYVGQVEHRGVIYPGEHKGIVEKEIWEEVNADLRSPDRGRERPYQRQSAMLSGILRCGACQKPMSPTYTAKGNRRYRYYVCQVARHRAWDACPTKSISASLIENSVVVQLRAALENTQTRESLKVPPSDWLSFQSGEIVPFVRAIAETVTFDGIRGEVSLKLREFTNQGDCNAC